MGTLPKDWSEQLARVIAADLLVADPGLMNLGIVAARLRLLRHEGVGEGLTLARQTLFPAPAKAEEHDAPLPPKIEDHYGPER